jgi:membrane protein implicated in regulation of membrane protease activity
MSIVYLLAFIAGILLGVRVMLLGIERRSRVRASSAGDIRPALPLVAGFLVGFGVAGYLTARFVGSVAALVTAVIVGAVVAGALRWLAIKSATSAELQPEDERFILQGHVAQVISSIAAGSEGRISFEAAGERRVLRARSLDEGAVGEGTEVVIERIEGDLAFVEPWVQVEQRL